MHPGLLLATFRVVYSCLCPDWLEAVQLPAQIYDAVAGMESLHAAANLSTKGPATGKAERYTQQTVYEDLPV